MVVATLGLRQGNRSGCILRLGVHQIGAVVPIFVLHASFEKQGQDDESGRVGIPEDCPCTRIRSQGANLPTMEFRRNVPC